MAAYSWTCLACGTSNSHSAIRCIACDCPIRCTVAQMELHRTQHLDAGHQVAENAGILKSDMDYGGLRLLLGGVTFFLLSWWPERDSPRHAPTKSRRP